MTTSADVLAYNQELQPDSKQVCDFLLGEVSAALPDAESKVWHGHPVWFLNGNPIVGYSQNKCGIQLLFWSGKSFPESGLNPIGKHQAAGVTVTSDAELDQSQLAKWLQDAREIQWDYANVVKKRSLDKLTDF